MARRRMRRGRGGLGYGGIVSRWRSGIGGGGEGKRPKGNLTLCVTGPVKRSGEGA